MANEQQDRQGQEGTTGQPNLSRGDLREGSDRNPGDTLGRDNDAQLQGGQGQFQQQEQAEGGRDEGSSGSQQNSDQLSTGGQQGSRGSMGGGSSGGSGGRADYGSAGEMERGQQGGPQGGGDIDPGNTGGFSPEGVEAAQGGFGDGSPSASDQDEGLQSFDEDEDLQEDELDNEDIGTDEIDDDSTTGGSATSFGR
jgi:hypothetical protein